MTKRKLSILLAVIAIAIEATAIVLVVPVVMSPTGAGGGIVILLLPAVIIGALLGLAAGVLGRRSGAAAHQGDGA